MNDMAQQVGTFDSTNNQMNSDYLSNLLNQNNNMPNIELSQIN